METERFRPREPCPGWRERLSAGHPERTVLLYVGRLAKEKSVGRLLGALRQDETVALAIVGDGPQRPRLEREFAGTPTTFLGLLEGEDLASAYAAADAFVLPSQTETLGMVVLEAKASGLPVIAAESPAARELIRHGVDGLRYDPRTPRSLEQAVGRLASDLRMRVAMGREARRSVKDASWSHATEALREHYRRAISARRRGDPGETVIGSHLRAPIPPQSGLISGAARCA